MKQTTIQIEIEEIICGAAVILRDKHGRLLDKPNAHELRLWQVINGKPEDWAAISRDVDMKDPGDYANWHKEFGERLLRVCANRAQVVTKVRVAKTFPAGGPRFVAVTAFWDRTVKKPLTIFDDRNGVWTLREYRKAKTSGNYVPRILTRIKDTLHCDGDDLYGYLPNGIPEGYVVEPDFSEVLVFHRTDENAPHWKFTFKATRA